MWSARGRLPSAGLPRKLFVAFKRLSRFIHEVGECFERSQWR